MDQEVNVAGVLDSVSDSCSKLVEKGHEYVFIISNQQQLWQIGSNKGRQFLEANTNLVQKFFEHCYSAESSISSSPVFTNLMPVVATSQTTALTMSSWLPSMMTAPPVGSSHLPSATLDSETLLVKTALESLAGFHMAQQNVTPSGIVDTPHRTTDVKDKGFIEGWTAMDQNSATVATRGQNTQRTNIEQGTLKPGQYQTEESDVVLSWTPLTPHDSQHVTIETEKTDLKNAADPLKTNTVIGTDCSKQEVTEETSLAGEKSLSGKSSLAEKASATGETSLITADASSAVHNVADNDDDDNDDDHSPADEDDRLSIGFEMDNDIDMEENKDIVCMVNRVVSGLENVPPIDMKDIKQEIESNEKSTKSKFKTKVKSKPDSKETRKKPKSGQKKQAPAKVLRSGRKLVSEVKLEKVLSSESEEVEDKNFEDDDQKDVTMRNEDVDTSDTEEYVRILSPSNETETRSGCKCRFCDKSFRNKSNLYRHEKKNHPTEKRECGRCSKVLKIKDMTKHVVKVHGYHVQPKKKPVNKDLMKCKICDEQLNTMYSLRRHMKIHEPGERFSCEVCKKSFCRKDVLKEHMLKHSGERPYSCQICKKSFFSMSILRGHEKIHAEVKDYLCLVCGKTFVQKFKLGLHMKNRHNEKQFKCDVCKKKFHSENDVRDHECPGPVEGSSDKNDEFPCTICNKIFQRRRNMLIHRRLHNDVQPRHQCTICQRIFRDRCNLTKHTRFVHSSVRNYVCDICGKSFKQNDTLKTHYKVHSSEKCKDFQCNECGKYFSGNTALTVHKRSHTGAKPFMCDICGMAFRQSGNMSKHMLIHTNAKFYKCELCGNEYKYQETWKAHMRGHAIKDGLSQDAVSTKYGKVYSCEHCGKKISTASQYKVHLRTHTNERPFNCELCEKAFKEKGKLSRHMKKVHLGNNGDEQPLLQTMKHSRSVHSVNNAVSQLPSVHVANTKKEHEQMQQSVIHTINVDSQMFKTYINLQSEPVVYYNMG